MKNITWLLLGSSLLLAGCNTTNPYQHSQVPVVEAGGPLTAGVLRDRNARMAAGNATQAPTRGPVSAPSNAWPNEMDSGVVAIPQGADTGKLETSPVISGEEIKQQYQQRQQQVQQRFDSEVKQQGAQLKAPVVALLGSADQAKNQGNLDSAAANLERALRISPREPEVLMRLAYIRLQQGNPAQAEQLAQQGLNAVPSNTPLAASLWDIIARARDMQHDPQGAQQARDKARVTL